MPVKQSLEQLVKQLVDALPPAMRALPKEVEKQFHQILHAAFTKMDLVTRDEFNAQKRVLERTREKLESLQKDVTKLEAHTRKSTRDTATVARKRSAKK